VKNEKTAVYSLTLILFSLMMPIYWFLKIKTWNPYSSGIYVLFILFLARAGGNVALVFIRNKMSVSIAAGILAILLFPMILIRSIALATFNIMFYAPPVAIIMTYAYFKKRTRFVALNFVKILAAGISACALYFIIIFMTGKSNPGLSLGGDGGGGARIFLGFGIVIIFIEIIALSTSCTFQKDEAKVGKQEKIDLLRTK